MIQGRGYTIPLDGLSTGTSDINDSPQGGELMRIVAGTDKTLAITYVSGHYRDGDSGQNVSFVLQRASAAAGGSGVTPEPNNPNDPVAGFTVATNPTSVTPSGLAMAAFGGNGGSNYSWYPGQESGQIILHPADILVLRVESAPASAQTMQGVIGVEEL